MKLPHYFLFVGLICGISCSRTEKNYRQRAYEVLSESVSNRETFESLIEGLENDPAKLEAFYFLVANMPGKYTYTTSADSAYWKALERIGGLYHKYEPEQRPYMIRDVLDSVYFSAGGHSVIHPDLDYITAEFLLANIDSAFNQWSRVPWANDYSQKDFYNWVLPYRTISAPIENWREKALSLDKPEGYYSTDGVYQRAVTLILDLDYGFSTAARYPFPLTFGQMLLTREGACGELSDYITQLFRAHGIPASSELVPNWANRSSSHAWNAVILPNGEFEPIGIDSAGILELNNKVPKIYRRRFSIDPNDVLYRYRDGESIPPFFSQYDLMDVTARYNLPVSNITVKNLKKEDTKIVWLSVFNNIRWVPVAYAQNKKGSAVFQDVAREGIIRKGEKFGRASKIGRETDVRYDGIGKGIVYMPTYYIDGENIPAGPPFILQPVGTKRELNPHTNQRQTVRMTRKYPKHIKFVQREESLIGGYFEGANRKDFSDAEVIDRIAEVQPFPFFENKPNHKGPFRYVRYVAPDSTFGNIAEIRLYSGEKQLSGRAFGVPGADPTQGPAAAFDGDNLSYYFAERANDVWVGLELDEPHELTMLTYVSRTDDNDIRVGDVYEMWYWNDGWQSLGVQAANEHFLEWEGVPVGALYYIRNLTRGREQRIFTYENGEVTWW